MRAQDDVLIGLSFPRISATNVMRYDRASHMIGNGISHHHLLPSRAARNALSIFPGHQKTGDIIDAFLEVPMWRYSNC